MRAFTLLELMLVVAVAATIAAVAVAEISVSIDSGRALAAARYIANRMASARAQAAMRSANVALRFEREGDGAMTVGTYVDGNRNGVRTADIAAGIDSALDPPIRVADLFAGVSVSVDADDAATSPSSVPSLMSFTAVGTATSGTVYVRSPHGRRFGVRVFGATARMRVLRMDPRTGELVERLF